MSNHRFFLITFFLIAVLILGATQCSRDNRSVAQIGSHERILAGDFEKSLALYIKNQDPDSVTLEIVRDHLDDLIESRLLLISAYEEQMDQDSTLLSKKKEITRRALIDQLYQKAVVDYVVKEKDIRDFYAKSDIKISARKIDLYVDAKADSAEETARLEEAQSLVQKIKDGEPFSRLARQHSDDRKTARKGGEMAPIWYRLTNDPIVEAAFSMKKGEVSDPIRVRSGYTILIVDDIQEENKRTYDEAYEGMKKYILDTRSEETNERARAYVDTLWSQQNATWNDEVIDTLTTLFRGWKNGKNQLVLIDSLEVLPDEFKARMIFTSNEQNFSVSDLLDHYKKKLTQYNRLAMENKSSFKRVLLTELRFRLLEDQAIRDRLDLDKVVIQQIKEKIDAELIKRKRNEIQGEVNPTEEELKAYYEENKADKYITKKKVQIQEILVRSEDLANELLQRIEAGEDFGTLAEKYTLRRGHKEKKGLIKPFFRGGLGKQGEKAFEMSVGEIAGPVPTHDHKQAIIKLVDVIEPELKPYSSVSRSVRQQYIKEILDERMADWVDEQVKKRNLYINDDLVESTWKSYADQE